MPKATADPFREEKTPAHDVMQLYLKSHLDEVVMDFFLKYYPQKLKIESGKLQSRSTISSEVSVHEPYKKHIVIDGLVTVNFVHNEIQRWRNEAVTYNQVWNLKNCCSDHLDNYLQIPLDEYASVWRPAVGRFERAVQKYRNTARDASSAQHAKRLGIYAEENVRLRSLEETCHYKAYRLESTIPYIIKKLSWRRICEDSKYLQAHSLQCDKLLVELKPKIFSFGDVLRQIHEYSSICKTGYPPLLITPDARFDQDFISENVAILHFEKRQLLDFALERNIPLREHDFNSTPEEPGVRSSEKVSAQEKLDFGGNVNL